MIQLTSDPMQDYQQFEIGGYKIQKEIGKGQFGKVYLAQNQKSSEVAIKTVKKSDLRKSSKRQELFETQRSIMRRVTNENVVKLYESLETEEYNLLVMEYCNDGDLHHYIKDVLGGAMTEDQALGSLIQILNGFKGLHEQLVLHRDIKLKNIMVHNGVLKIADFGLSKMGSVATTVVGTPYTKAPEVFKKKKYDNKADIWSLGIIFYQMIFRLQYPFTAKTEQQLFSKIIGGEKPNFKTGDVKISPSCQDLLERMLTTDPSKRINWKDISQHPAIVAHQNLLQNHTSAKISAHSQYYEQIEQHMSTYEQLRLSINTYFTCLSSLIALIARHPEFRKVNILYFQFLVCKQMRWNMSMLKEALQKCMEISQVSETIGREELENCAAEVENYYTQSRSGKMQLFLADRQKSNPEIQREVATYEPDPMVFRKFACRLCDVLEKKLHDCKEFKEAPNIQKLVMETVQGILMLFIPEYSEAETPETLEGMRKRVNSLRRKVSGQ